MRRIEIAPQSENGWKVGVTFGHTIAIALCYLRYYVRWRRSLVWWDDQLVALTASFNIFTAITIWTTKNSGYTVEADGIIYYNLLSVYLPCYIVMWSSRISLWLSLGRIYSPGQSARRISLSLTALYTLIAVASLCMATLGCEDSGGGTRQRTDRCYSLGISSRTKYEKMTMSIAVADLVTDVVLVLVPALLLSDSNLPATEKRLIVLLGSGSFLTLVSLSITTFITYGPFVRDAARHRLVHGAIHISTFIALIAANTLVVGTAAYKFFGCRRSQGPTESTLDSMSGLRIRTGLSALGSQQSPATSFAIKSALTELERGVLNLQADGTEKRLTTIHPEPKHSTEDKETKLQTALI